MPAAKKQSDKPAPVGFNFDTYVAEPDAREPFAFVWKSKQYECVPPGEIDLKVASKVGSTDIEGQLRLLIGKDGAREIMGSPDPIHGDAWAAFENAYQAHYEVGPTASSETD